MSHSVAKGNVYITEYIYLFGRIKIMFFMQEKKTEEIIIIIIPPRPGNNNNDNNNNNNFPETRKY